MLVQCRVAGLDVGVLGTGALGIGTGLVAFADEGRVELLERVYLADVVAQYGTHRGQFALQAQDFGRTVGLRLLQLLQERLGAGLFGVEAGDERIVAHAFLQFAVLAGKLSILVLHLALVEFGQLAEFFQFFLLVGQLLGVVVAGGQEDHQARKQQEASEQMKKRLHAGRGLLGVIQSPSPSRACRVRCRTGCCGAGCRAFRK